MFFNKIDFNLQERFDQDWDYGRFLQIIKSIKTLISAILHRYRLARGINEKLLGYETLKTYSCLESFLSTQICSEWVLVFAEALSISDFT